MINAHTLCWLIILTVTQQNVTRRESFHTIMSSNSTNVVNQTPVTNVNACPMIYQQQLVDSKITQDYLQTVVGISTHKEPFLQHAHIQSNKGMPPTSINTPCCIVLDSTRKILIVFPIIKFIILFLSHFERISYGCCSRWSYGSYCN